MPTINSFEFSSVIATPNSPPYVPGFVNAPPTWTRSQYHAVTDSKMPCCARVPGGTDAAYIWPSVRSKASPLKAVHGTQAAFAEMVFPGVAVPERDQ